MSPRPTYIRYGDENLPLFLPKQTKQLSVSDPEKAVTPESFRQNIQLFLEQEPLNLSNPVVVVADKTRLCGYPEYLPILIDEFVQKGMNPEAVTFIIAYGTHPDQTREECIAAYGDIYNTHTFIHHSADDTDCFTDLGVTAKGTPIRFRKDLIEASAIITMGAVTHHYFAGYGGGRKLIFPGCGEKQAIYANHGLFLNSKKEKLSAGCQPGNLTNNPLADDLFEIEAHLPAHLSIHGLLDSKGAICDLLVGKGRETFDEACARQGASCEVSSEQFDVVIASSGGFPKDINFIQAHKAINNSAMFVKDGGLLLVYCECRDSVGSTTFLPWFEQDSFQSAFALLADNYVGNGGTALSMMTKSARIQIGLITSLDDEIIDTIGVTRWNHSQVSEHLLALSPDTTIACIDNASLLVKKH
ncbi:lactate racemase domain-containing protein [Desulforhopalus sp. 52FAK]